ncbi:LysR family transcriptional regulator [Rhodoferax sp.]|uniref:LysR family transcriptional regulator n=1 Tax=Rhodoferax sp. TaxID=50421 RepID=UPI002768B934|nr:LysR family transcriptional regulator [Rhodoferax sp.]
MNLELDDVALFLRIRALGTLSAAARERNWPVSQVSRALVRLEAACGARLLHRSTHGLSLTDEGDTFAQYAQRLLDTRDELALDLSGKHNAPSGWVRVGVSPLLAQMVLAPSLNGLYALHPQLRIDIVADDRMADMAREGIDIAIRTGSPNSEALVARQIGDYSRSLYAAPAYLARRGTPQHPAELAQHHLITSSNPALNRWPLRSDHASRPGTELEAQGHTRTDNSAVMLSLVQHGVGIGRLMDLLALPLVARGELVPVLAHAFAMARVPIFAVMLQERHRLPKIRACIDYWAQWLARMVSQPGAVTSAPGAPP